MAVPRTTHTWLKRLYDYIDDLEALIYPSGQTGIPQGMNIGVALVTRVGTSTGILGMYGFSGYAQIAAAPGNLGATYVGASGAVSTGVGASGLYYHLGKVGYNGATGSVYTIDDIVIQLKNMGILPL